MVAINHQNLRKVRFPLLKHSKATGAEGRVERRFGWEWDAMAGWHPLSAQRSFGPTGPSVVATTVRVETEVRERERARKWEREKERANELVMPPPAWQMKRCWKFYDFALVLIYSKWASRLCHCRLQAGYEELLKGWNVPTCTSV